MFGMYGFNYRNEGDKMKLVRRKVVCVYGKFDNKSDFVLEPAYSDGEDVGEVFWIEKVEPKEKK